MFRPRVIPVLLLKNSALYKSVRFRKHRYIGDPINAVRIFNDLKADELVFLDIEASRNNTLISPEFVKAVGEEAYMPLAVGGGIKSVEDIRTIINAGAEKVVINTHAARNPAFIKQAAEVFGSSAITVCIDVKKNFFGKPHTYILGGSKQMPFSPVDFAGLMEENGAGELIIQSIDRDGMMNGYEIELVKSVSVAVGIPVVALGGAGNNDDLVEGYRSGFAGGLAAGSIFVYQGKSHSVLINYPDKSELLFDR